MARVWLRELLESLPGILLGVAVVSLDSIGYGMVLFPTSAYPRRFGEEFAMDGIKMFLLTSAIGQIIFASKTSSFKTLSALMLIETIPFLHEIGGTIIENAIERNLDIQSTRATVVLGYGLASIFCGTFFIILGFLRLGSILNWFPRSFLTGTVGGIGYFLLQVAFEITTGKRLELNLNYLDYIMNPTILFRWVPAISFAVASTLFLRKNLNHAAVITISSLLLIFLFYIYLSLQGLSMDEARYIGWLPQLPSAQMDPFPFVHLWQMVVNVHIDWMLLAKIIPSLIFMSIFAFLQLSVNLPVLALSVRRDHFDINRELKAHGLSNITAGVFMSVPNYLEFANSMLCIQSNLKGRLASFVIGIGLLIMYTVGIQIVQLLPMAVVGFLNFHLAFTLMNQALFEKTKLLSLAENAVVIATFLIVVFLGFNYCTLFGGILAIVLWFKNEGQYYFRRRMRPHCTVISSESKRTLLRLEAKKFTFTNMHPYLESLEFYCPNVGKKLVKHETRFGKYTLLEQSEPAPYQFLLLDISQIEFADYSALSELGRIVRKFRQNKAHLFIVSPQEGVTKFIQESHIFLLTEPEDVCESQTAVGYFESLEDAESWLEEWFIGSRPLTLYAECSSSSEAEDSDET